MRSADLTARARIRTAAIAAFADTGFARTTVRRIADDAGVSPALVLHHFGTKDALRHACDDYLLAWIHDQKIEAFTAAVLPTTADTLAAHPEAEPMYAYLRRTVREGGPAADALFDRLVVDVAEYLAAGEATGTVRPSDDPQARAALQAAIGIGLLTLDTQLARHLGGDSLLHPPVDGRFTAAVLDLYSHGLLAGALADEQPHAGRATHVTRARRGTRGTRGTTTIPPGGHHDRRDQ